MRKLLSLAVTAIFGLTLGACQGDSVTSPAQSPDADVPEVSADAAPRSAGTFTRTTWANDELWQWQRPQPVFNQGQGNDKFVFVTSRPDNAQRPFYVVGYEAGDDGKQSELFFGGNGHDHVTTAPRGSDPGSFKATVQLFVLLPGADAEEGDIATTPAVNFFTGKDIELPYAADVDGSGTIDSDEDFTNVEVVEKAMDAGLVKAMTTFEETVLTMHPMD